MAKRKITITGVEDNWVTGLYKGQWFQAKVFEVGSEYGISDGRVSKLCVSKTGKWEGLSVETVAFNYDRGMDIDAPIGHEIAKALEALPKLIVARGYMVEV